MKSSKIKWAAFSIFILCFHLLSCDISNSMFGEEVEDICGTNVFLADHRGIPQHVKEMVKDPPIGYRRVGHSSAKLVIIPFEFKDELPHNSAVTHELIRDNFFAEGTGSVKDYFLENSWGKFTLEEGAIADVVTLKYSPAYYGKRQKNKDWTRNSRLHQEICAKANVDWAAFDSNHDGIVDNEEVQICFMSSGGGSGSKRMSSPTVMGYAGKIKIASQHFVFFDCKRDDDPQKDVEAIAYNYPTIWHELCHGLFEIPDRYNNFCGSGSTGRYDIMSDNCGRRHMNIFDKIKLGWVKPHIVNSVGIRQESDMECFSFPAIEKTPAALVYYNQLAPDEYWIIENRHKAASSYDFEEALPESGLAVWWVDATTNKIHLVDAGQPSQRPQDYVYSSSKEHAASLFRAEPCVSEEYTETLMDQNASPQLMLRSVSLPGRTMSCEL